MGILDRIAARVAAEITKAPTLPTGSVAMTESQMRNSAMAQNQGYGTQVPLPRDQNIANVPFSPGVPIIPGAINPLQDRGRPDPRRYEFLVAQNINITETRLVPFKTLRAAADQIDILRRCIEVLKNKVAALDWDIVISDDASEKIIAESGGNHLQAMDKARTEFASEIDRLVDFWKMPDVAEGLTFADWIRLCLEEVLVLDAWAIWPQKTVGGDLMGFKVLDGSTIKPLINDLGFRPTPEQGPAYQQILYGFPRTEFDITNDAPDADGEFTSDQLVYNIMNRRTWTVYGYSPVERSLMIADIYLRRQQWIRAEYTDGVVPEMLFETDATFGNNPELLRAYENIFNDDLAGQTEQRKRARLLPAGIKAVQLEGYGEKFSDVFDEYLVTSICGHFGVLPTEIGFSSKGGIGASGHQKGEAESAQQLGLEPLQQWLGKVLTNLSHSFLGMPRELEFKFMASTRNDTKEQADRDDTEVRNGGLTINEHRAENGMPLLDTPEADMPILVAGQSVYLFTPDGIVAAGTSLDENGIQDNEPSATEAPKEEAPDTPERTEVKKFIRWANRGTPTRPFNFEHLDHAYAETLNKFIEAKDIDGARWYAERYLGL
jgi:Phage portal protein